MKKKKRKNYKPSGAVYYTTSQHKEQRKLGEYDEEGDDKRGDKEDDKTN